MTSPREGETSSDSALVSMLHVAARSSLLPHSIEEQIAARRWLTEKHGDDPSISAFLMLGPLSRRVLMARWTDRCGVREMQSKRQVVQTFLNQLAQSGEVVEATSACAALRLDFAQFALITLRLLPQMNVVVITKPLPVPTETGETFHLPCDYLVGVPPVSEKDLGHGVANGTGGPRDRRRNHP